MHTQHGGAVGVVRTPGYSRVVAGMQAADHPAQELLVDWDERLRGHVWVRVTTYYYCSFVGLAET